MLVQRYIGREILLATLAITLVLLLIGISNQFVVYLADAAKGELSPSLVFKVVAMHLPSLLGLLLPLALFFGIMLALSRLYAESEMTALLACGLPYKRLLQTVFWPALLVTGIALVLNLWLAPHYLYQVTKTLAEAENDLMTRAIVPGRFQASDDGKYVLYIDHIDSGEKKAYDVFIAEQEQSVDDEFHLGVIASESGYQWQDPNTRDEYIVLEDGNRYQGRPGEKEYQLMTFKEYGLRILQRQAKFKVRESAMPSKDLINTNVRDEQAELQWRLTIALSSIVLAMLALIIAKVKPRQGKYAKALPAIITAIVYINVLIFARGLYEDTSIPFWIGLFWVPASGAIAAGLGIWWQANKL